LILEGQERWQEALTEYDHALRIDSASMDALAHKGGVLVELKGEEAPVLPIGNRMIQLNPKDPRGWNIKAMALCMRKEYREAEKVIDQALALSHDGNVRALTLKAIICEETGRKSEARKLMNRAAKLDPQNEFIQEVKGEMGLSQYDESHKPTVAEAKRSLIVCWVFTVVVGLIFIAPLISTLSEGSIPFLFALPFGLYSGWSLYWGWGPMWWRWNPFRDAGNAVRGMERDAESRELKRAIVPQELIHQRINGLNLSLLRYCML
jgi:tetratricopeptide (TPR) repeat protein